MTKEPEGTEGLSGTRLQPTTMLPKWAAWGFQQLRQQLLTATRTRVGEQKFGTWRQLPPKERLRALQGDRWWGPHAETGDEWIQTYLLHLEQERAVLPPVLADHQRRRAAAVRSSAWQSVSHITRRQCWREGPWLRLRLVHDVINQWAVAHFLSGADKQPPSQTCASRPPGPAPPGGTFYIQQISPFTTQLGHFTTQLRHSATQHCQITTQHSRFTTQHCQFTTHLSVGERLTVGTAPIC